MKRTLKLCVATALAATTFLGTTFVDSHDANARGTGIYSSCKAFNHVYPHGVKKTAKTKNAVHQRHGGIIYRNSSAKVSASIYKKAIQKNYDLDRDNDNIACEK
ncbi:excalibur calcium-binding domain-containing protein [Rummeliibacillus sp. NPDC094406]|uniref:excalibur calcium-binding domain-containing protein n=1 Tax=Rummeliibacillus sp. NPDC094406 TaxID=3364511 RepID=UPI00381C1330